MQKNYNFNVKIRVWSKMKYFFSFFFITKLTTTTIELLFEIFAGVQKSMNGFIHARTIVLAKNDGLHARGVRRMLFR